MPSGSKKRKAAKKKKEMGTINNPQGNDELKFRDEKRNDDGEGGSPSHRDYDDDDDHTFNEGNEDVEESDTFNAQPLAADAESVEEVPSDDKIGEASEGKQDVVLERDLKSGENSESRNLSLVHVESAKELDYRNGNSNAGLNDEIVAENANDEIVAENANDERDDSVKEEVTFDEMVKSIDSSHEKMASILENAQLGETGNSVPEPPVDDSVDSLVRPIDLATNNNEDNIHPGSNSAQHVDDSDTQECSENQPLVASAPHVVQKASWLNCCGLFEVLRGSDR